MVDFPCRTRYLQYEAATSCAREFCGWNRQGARGRAKGGCTSLIAFQSGSVSSLRGCAHWGGGGTCGSAPVPVTGPPLA